MRPAASTTIQLKETRFMADYLGDRSRPRQDE